MAEEKAEKKKLGIVRRIFKWIGLGLLAVLIILGLIFQAPWKVIALLLIILAACTQLPRPARKWFWFSVAAVVLILIIWVFLPENSEGWRPYTFDEELAALEAKYAISDSENAATIYNALLEDYDPNTMHPDFLDPNIENLTRREPWSSRDYPELAKWLEDQQSTIETLIQVSKIEKCRFPISKDIFDFVSVPSFAAMRHWAFLLVRAGNNDLGEDRIDQALEKQIAILQMAKHLYQQPILVDWLVSIAIEGVAIGQFKRLVVTGDATNEHLSVIEKALAGNKHNWSSDWPRILDYEKLIAKKEFAKYYEVNPKGKIRLSRDPWAEMRACWKEQLEANQIEYQQMREVLESYVYLTYWQKKLIRAKTILSWFYIPSTPQKAAKIIDASYEKYYAMAEPGFDWKKEPKEFSLTSLKLNFRFMVQSIVNMLEETYYRIHDIYLRTIAEKRGSRLIIALRRYKNKNGRWPESLEDIKSIVPEETFVDPFNEGPFVYKLTADSFKLYSKGKNNIDEDGKYRRGLDDWPIWPGPGRSRKTKEENADAEQQ